MNKILLGIIALLFGALLYVISQKQISRQSAVVEVSEMVFENLSSTNSLKNEFEEEDEYQKKLSEIGYSEVGMNTISVSRQ
ncbi:MAG TPA: hypothetical protein PJ997_02955 [Candidatus Paceibacterota bacterium]|nr:hypothetical protein [Candidatus Paceibacterota bacterium]HMP19267.1 hypothetical protein [Candidatus Paceibacterota bacterium]